ncbi:MAG: NADH dehydrogenase [Bacteroidetes bacterium GWF2_43_63]|nr:MAG: NADH dehydrogenase [Bacteroidetes bacterium GWE2_42_42]OFY55271.1 MAG: NADH dehydrogenase [Bacteroidetes bacterium GWF2_43_63]HBG70904.1 NADH-quinone oxidoreductase subunit F [Bacteroidales bacterium]HCB63332.1 NADH-quinone oxidoreductase subunit F [Bacteroidales bacterium]HCY23035.1 NADH-quinone oxidoreductase subunit F [Bacteroidales bacterium]
MAETIVRVGMASCGIAAGARKVFDTIKGLQNTDHLRFELQQTGCIGMCFREPLVEVIDENGSYLYGEVDAEKVLEILNKHVRNGEPVRDYIVRTDLFASQDDPFWKGQVKIALRNCGVIDPENLDDYMRHGGYDAVKKIMTDNISRENIIQTIIDSGLRGRGGGGFSTGMKWKFAFNSQNETKYIICNADEGDPGAFMDRSLIEGDPHAIIEGMIIGAYAIGASDGVIYCRAEYPLAIKRLNIAIGQAHEKGFLGKNIFGKQGFNFDLYVKEGAGAFVCGEETALMASIEGERGMPRRRPPFPAVSGLYKKPTNINNVETWANVSWIILNGPEKYAAFGTEKSKGTKVFALAGKINHGGLVEVPMGIPLRDVIFKLGGGIQNNKKFKAVQMGGPSGGCIPEHLLDTIVDYDSVTATGAIMGSGGLVVMDENTCMVDMARFFLDFTQKESCGKCTFCRVGTKRLLEILRRITEGEGREGDIELLEELCEQIKTSSLCGLGQTAPNPVLTTLKYFRNEYEAHIFNKKCPAHNCKKLLTYTVETDKCTGCTVCAKNCPTNAISGERKLPHLIDQSLCIKCGVCFSKCKFDAITLS